MYDAFAFDEPVRGAIARYREQEPIRRAARRAAKIATISCFSRDRLAARLDIDPARITVIPLAPDPLFRPGDEPSPLDRPYMLFVAGAEARKNAPFFLDAFAQAFPQRDIALAIAGRLEPAAEAFLATGGIAAIRLAPDDLTLRALYRNAIAVAVPSRAEGFGLVAAEALACGAAVIAADAAALPEVTGDAALLVDPANAAGWIDALRAVASDNELRAGLCAKGAARFAFARRDEAAETTLDLLAALV
jgi:glycosyltransferase involved in cell wall biosynthesis